MYPIVDDQTELAVATAPGARDCAARGPATNSEMQKIRFMGFQFLGAPPNLRQLVKRVHESLRLDPTEYRRVLQINPALVRPSQPLWRSRTKQRIETRDTHCS